MLKPALPIAIALDILIAAVLVLACGVPSDVEPEVAEETGVEPENIPCAEGMNNHQVTPSTCICDEGFAWCNDKSLDCCP